MFDIQMLGQELLSAIWLLLKLALTNPDILTILGIVLLVSLLERVYILTTRMTVRGPGQVRLGTVVYWLS